MQYSSKKLIKRPFRSLFFIVLMVVIGSVLSIRLVDLQVIHGAEYRRQADNNRFFSDRIPPKRGAILDRYQEPLVRNLPQYYMVENQAALYGERTPLSWEDALERMADASSSAQVRHELVRQYPYGAATAHVLGYTGPVTREDMLANRQLHITDSVGKIGLEALFDQSLRGTAGSRMYEVDALARRQRELALDPGQPGQSLATTIDPYISTVALEAIQPQMGAVVVLDADTAQVLALVSSPSFDPNVFAQQFDDPQLEQKRAQTVAGYFSHPGRLFFNRAIAGVYPPGSVFKLVTGLAGLEHKVLDAATTVNDEGTLKVGEWSYANWYYTQYGRVEGAINLQRSLARSNDIYFYKAAEWVGPVRLASMARLFGLGQKTGIELAGEAAGLVPDPEWKEKTLGERWFLGNTYHYGIGQDNLLATPLQVAQLTQAFVNRGRLCHPSVVVRDAPDCRELSVAEQDLAVILNGMLDACSAGGTGFPFFAHNTEYRNTQLEPFEAMAQGAVACKTGTSEFGGTDERGFKTTHGWFVMSMGIDFERLGVGEFDDEAVDVDGADTGALVEVEGVEELSELDEPVATQSATPAKKTHHDLWLERVAQHGFPRRIVIAVLVESDEAQPYKEGSREAAPVAKSIVDWMYGENSTQAANELAE